MRNTSSSSGVSSGGGVTKQRPPAAGAGGEPAEGEAGSTDRLLVLSDGVFAIAITLLVLDVKVPRVEDAAPTVGAVWAALLRQWPSYFAYTLSFLNIGVMWANHVALFRYIKRADHLLTLFNTLLLLCICLNPFITSLLAEYLLLSPAHRQVSVTVFDGYWLVTAVFFQAVWFYASGGGGRLIDRRFGPRHYREISVRYLFGLGCYLVALLLALFGQPVASLALATLLSVMFALPYTVSQARQEVRATEDAAGRIVFRRGFPRRK